MQLIQHSRFYLSLTSEFKVKVSVEINTYALRPLYGPPVLPPHSVLQRKWVKLLATEHKYFFTDITPGELIAIRISQRQYVDCQATP